MRHRIMCPIQMHTYFHNSNNNTQRCFNNQPNCRCNTNFSHRKRFSIKSFRTIRRIPIKTRFNNNNNKCHPN